MQLLNVALGGTLDQHLADTRAPPAHPGPVHRPRGPARAGLARGPGRRAPSGSRSTPTTTRASTELGDGARRQRLVGAGRADRGDRAARAPLGARRPLAPRGGAPRGAVAALAEAARAGCRDEPGATIAVIEPATERVMAELPRAGVEETDAAVARAKAAFPAWRAIAPGDRARLLLRDLATRSRSAPRSWRRSRRATPASRSATRAARSGWSPSASATTPAGPERLLGQTIPVAGGVDMTFREPLGVVGLITPWNFPLVIASWKVAPALAAGNTIVLKPAELTPLTALELERIAARRGAPRGRAQRRRRAGLGLRQAAGRAPRRRQDRLHRLDRGRARDRGRRRADDQAGDARARRQVGERRLRRRRPRGGGRGGAGGGVRQRGPGLLRALADPGRALGARRLHGGARARGHRRSSSATRSPRRPRWGR